MPFWACQYPDISHYFGPSYVDFVMVFVQCKGHKWIGFKERPRRGRARAPVWPARSPVCLYQGVQGTPIPLIYIYNMEFASDFVRG